MDDETVSISGLPEFKAALDAAAAHADAAARQVVARAAALLEAEAKRNFSGSHKRGRPHIGGTLPNVVTGTLRRSIRHEPVTKVGLGTWGTRVGPTAVYGRRVELGYRGSKAYAYFSPAFKKVKPQIRAMAVAAFESALKGGR